MRRLRREGQRREDGAAVTKVAHGGPAVERRGSSGGVAGRDISASDWRSASSISLSGSMDTLDFNNICNKGQSMKARSAFLRPFPMFVVFSRQ